MAALAFQQFSFTYAGAHTPAIQHVNWSIDQGTFALLIGPTGSGKSTLLRCAHPCLAPAGVRTGEVRIAGQPFEQLRDARDSAPVALVGQRPAEQIVCDSVWHEMAFGLENSGTDAAVIRQRVAEVAHYFGIESWFRRATQSLSGGQQQLLNLASALCLRPQVLLLDEPTSQLDPVAATGFAHALFRVNRELGITVVVATHDTWQLAPYATTRFALDANASSAGQNQGEQKHSLVPQNGIHLSVPAEAPEPVSAATEPFLDFSEVVFAYDRNDAAVLDNFSLKVERGSIHALVGGNGSGKTTALLVAAGVHKPQHGRVVNRSRAQALLPQDPQALFACDTVRDELLEWQDACGYVQEDVDRWAKLCALDGLLDQHPLDVSGGQQQMLALAKLMLAAPDLLLLDEPTKGLDAAARWHVARVLRAARLKQTTIVIATHDLAFCRLFADTVSLVFDGQVATSSSAKRFFADNLFFQANQEALDALLVAGAQG